MVQSFPKASNDKDVAAMLVELTIEADEESFVIVLQHGDNDVTCKRSIGPFRVLYACQLMCMWACVFMRVCVRVCVRDMSLSIIFFISVTSNAAQNCFVIFCIAQRT